MRRKDAFTLVELLVVIGIIALLISILLPTLGRARARARQMKCMSTMREYGHAINMYLNDNRNTYMYPGQDGTNVQMWTYQLFRGKYLGHTIMQNLGAAGNSVGQASLDKIYCPEMWSSDLPVPGIKQSEAEWAASGNINTIGYVFSYGLVGRKAGNLKDSASRMMVMEFTPGFAVVPQTYSSPTAYGGIDFCRAQGWFHFHHKSRTDVLYMDNHVDSLTLKDLPPYDRVFWNTPKN